MNNWIIIKEKRMRLLLYSIPLDDTSSLTVFADDIGGETQCIVVFEMYIPVLITSPNLQFNAPVRRKLLPCKTTLVPPLTGPLRGTIDKIVVASIYMKKTLSSVKSILLFEKLGITRFQPSLQVNDIACR